MLTNFTAYQAHLTDVGGGEHPSPIAHSFQHRIHFTCMAIDRQWQDAPFILRMLGFDLEIVNAVTYVIISNIFHGYV